MKITRDRELSGIDVGGADSVTLVDKIVRERVFDSVYWKQYCFNVDLLSIQPLLCQLRFVGDGSSPFVCLLVKLLQLVPDRQVVEFFIEQKQFKYMKCVFLLYFRIVYREFEYLKAHLADYRRIRVKQGAGSGMKLYHVDEFVNDLLQDQFVCGISLPMIKKESKYDSIEL